jgi:NAD(P)H-hydrate epimerase
MAKGGSGDVLTGIITSTLAQGYPTDKACLISVYIHGLAGDQAAKEFGQIGFTISDLIKKIGPAFQYILEEK